MIVCLGLFNIDITFAVNNSSSRHINNRKIDILILVEDPTESLDDTAIRAEAMNSPKINMSNKKEKLFRSTLQCK